MCGVRDDRTKRRLLTESNLTFQRAWEIARSMETAGKNVAAVQKELVKETKLTGNRPINSRSPAKDRVVAPYQGVIYTAKGVEEQTTHPVIVDLKYGVFCLQDTGAHCQSLPSKDKR